MDREKRRSESDLATEKFILTYVSSYSIFTHMKKYFNKIGFTVFKSSFNLLVCLFVCVEIFRLNWTQTNDCCWERERKGRRKKISQRGAPRERKKRKIVATSLEKIISTTRKSNQYYMSSIPLKRGLYGLPTGKFLPWIFSTFLRNHIYNFKP